jgi:hypothetical protein
MSSDAKRFETEAAIDDGAHEIDVVLNLGRLKAGDDKFVLRELCDVVEAADEWPVKVILETCLLTREEKIRACQIWSLKAARSLSKPPPASAPRRDDCRCETDARNRRPEVRRQGFRRHSRHENRAGDD